MDIIAGQFYKDRFDSALTPVAKQVSRRALTLPLYPDLPLDVVDKICDPPFMNASLIKNAWAKPSGSGCSA